MYLEFFGLSEFPFNITPDPRFLYLSPRHREAMDLLLYGVANRKGFIELTGEVGCGKTTTLRAVLSRLPGDVETALVLNPCLNQTQLLRAILNDFGIQVASDDRLDLIEQLNEFLLMQAERGRNVLIVIDEAQDLDAEVMEQVRLLSNLETDEHKLMQIILCGQPELRERLAQRDLRQLRQRILIRCHLQPLNPSDTAEYISHRLQISGAAEDVWFEPSAVERVYHYAGGIPRLVNAVCDLAMLSGYASQVRQIGDPQVEKALQQLECTV
jgi:general secretion pathway protein A